MASSRCLLVQKASSVAGPTHLVEDMLLSDWRVAAELAGISIDSAVGSAVSGVPVS